MKNATLHTSTYIEGKARGVLLEEIAFVDREVELRLFESILEFLAAAHTETA